MESPVNERGVSAWLGLPRRERRRIRAEVRKHLARPGLAKAERRRMTPWQPIVVTPAQAATLSGRATTKALQLAVLGFNRARRRAMFGKKGPHRPSRYGRPNRFGEVRSDRRSVRLMDRFFLQAEYLRRGAALADRQRIFYSRPARALRWLVRYPLAGAVVLWRYLLRALGKHP